MLKKTILVAALMASSWAQAAITVIAHPTTPDIDIKDVKKAFLGKKTEANGMKLQPVMNASAATTNEFIDQIMEQSPDQFNAYWTEKVFTGKGAKPNEFPNDDAVIGFVCSNPGAIGYVTKEPPKTVKIIK